LGRIHDVTCRKSRESHNFVGEGEKGWSCGEGCKRREGDPEKESQLALTHPKRARKNDREKPPWGGKKGGIAVWFKKKGGKRSHHVRKITVPQKEKEGEEKRGFVGFPIPRECWNGAAKKDPLLLVMEGGGGGDHLSVSG